MLRCPGIDLGKENNLYYILLNTGSFVLPSNLGKYLNGNYFLSAACFFLLFWLFGINNVKKAYFDELLEAG